MQNTGTTLTIDFAAMNFGSKDAHQHLISELNKGLAAAEYFGKDSQKVNVVNVSEVSAANESGDWWLAVGKYRTWASGTVIKNGNNYKMKWSFNFRDNYDWHDNGLSMGLVSDSEMVYLNECGVAREFEMVGNQNIEVSWQKGQRVGTGAVIKGVVLY